MRTKSLKETFSRHEFFMVVAILVLGLVIQAQSGQFFDSNNLVDMLRASITPCTFAVGTYMVLVSGGIDLSFPAISALTSYIVVVSQINITPDDGGNVLVGYLMCLLIGGLFGALNGFLISYYKLPAMIVTLGTSNLYWGILFGPLKNLTFNLPENLNKWSRTYLLTVTNPKSDISATLPALAITTIIIIGLAWFIMNKTMIGRGLYAIGGNRDAASRVGFNVLALQTLVYAMAGGIAGIAGYNRVINTRILNTVFTDGTEMTIIAGVVLGGVRITGGVGTLSGAILGTVFLTILTNSLLLLGLSPYWANAATGIVIILGISLSSLQVFMERRKRIKRREQEQLLAKGEEA